MASSDTSSEKFCGLSSSQSQQSLASSLSSFITKSSVSPSVARTLYQHGMLVDTTGKVTWDDTSSHHPRNWSRTRKCYDTALILCLELLMTLVSNTGSLTADQAYESLGISRKAALLSFTFSYLGGQAIGGLLLPPISETFGGQHIYVATTALFAMGNIMIGTWPNHIVIVVARFATGFFSAMPGTVAAGSLENMWDARARIWTIHLWIVFAVLGLCAGPVVSEYIGSSHLGWHWTYLMTGLISIGATLACFGMKESRPSKVLRQKVEYIKRLTGFEDLVTEDEEVTQSLRKFCHDSLFLPVRLFFTEPIVMLTSLMAATVYAIIYVFPEVLPVVYQTYGYSTQQISLVNLFLAISIPLTFLPRIVDIRTADRRRSAGEADEPEDKIFGFMLAAPCLAVSFVVFAGCIPPLNPHVGPFLSMCCLIGVGFATIEFDNVLSGYLPDSYSSYAASANAPMSFLRAALSGIFPLFAGDLLNVVNANVFVFMLAGLAALFCLVAIWFKYYGKVYREKSKFATRTAEMKRQSMDEEKIIGGSVRK